MILSWRWLAKNCSGSVSSRVRYCAFKVTTAGISDSSSSGSATNLLYCRLTVVTLLAPGKANASASRHSRLQVWTSSTVTTPACLATLMGSVLNPAPDTSLHSFQEKYASLPPTQPASGDAAAPFPGQPAPNPGRLMLQLPERRARRSCTPPPSLAPGGRPRKWPGQSCLCSGGVGAVLRRRRQRPAAPPPPRRTAGLGRPRA